MSKKLFALLFVMLMLCGAALADGITVTDMHGREIALDQPATRIVALTPRPTAKSSAPSAARTRSSAAANTAIIRNPFRRCRSCSPARETNIEEILALDPQVVLMSDMSQTEEQAKLLEQNGVKVVISDANDIAACTPPSA